MLNHWFVRRHNYGAYTFASTAWHPRTKHRGWRLWIWSPLPQQRLHPQIQCSMVAHAPTGFAQRSTYGVLNKPCLLAVFCFIVCFFIMDLQHPLLWNCVQKLIVDKAYRHMVKKLGLSQAIPSAWPMSVFLILALVDMDKGLSNKCFANFLLNKTHQIKK